MVPELFVHEINKLDWEDRQRFERDKIGFQRADGELLDVDEQQNIAMNKNDRLTELKDKSMKMELYLYEQARDMFDLYYDSMK